MSEARFAGRVSCHLRQLGAHVQRVETPRTGAGVPDLSYAYGGVEGWVELKYAAAWPARPTTRVRLDRDARKFGRQVQWLLDRASAGNGRCWVLARVGDEHVLWGPGAFDALVGGASRGKLLELAAGSWGRALDYAALLELLTGSRDRP